MAITPVSSTPASTSVSPEAESGVLPKELFRLIASYFPAHVTAFLASSPDSPSLSEIYFFNPLEVIRDSTHNPAGLIHWIQTTFKEIKNPLFKISCLHKLLTELIQVPQSDLTLLLGLVQTACAEIGKHPNPKQRIATMIPLYQLLIDCSEELGLKILAQIEQHDKVLQFQTSVPQFTQNHHHQPLERGHMQEYWILSKSKILLDWAKKCHSDGQPSDRILDKVLQNVFARPQFLWNDALVKKLQSILVASVKLYRKVDLVHLFTTYIDNKDEYTRYTLMHKVLQALLEDQPLTSKINPQQLNDLFREYQEEIPCRFFEEEDSTLCQKKIFNLFLQLQLEVDPQQAWQSAQNFHQLFNLTPGLLQTVLSYLFCHSCLSEEHLLVHQKEYETYLGLLQQLISEFRDQGDNATAKQIIEFIRRYDNLLNEKQKVDFLSEEAFVDPLTASKNFDVLIESGIRGTSLSRAFVCIVGGLLHHHLPKEAVQFYRYYLDQMRSLPQNLNPFQALITYFYFLHFDLHPTWKMVKNDLKERFLASKAIPEEALYLRVVLQAVNEFSKKGEQQRVQEALEWAFRIQGRMDDLSKMPSNYYVAKQEFLRIDFKLLKSVVKKINQHRQEKLHFIVEIFQTFVEAAQKALTEKNLSKAEAYQQKAMEIVQCVLKEFVNKRYLYGLFKLHDVMVSHQIPSKAIPELLTEKQYSTDTPLQPAGLSDKMTKVANKFRQRFSYKELALLIDQLKKEERPLTLKWLWDSPFQKAIFEQAQAEVLKMAPFEQLHAYKQLLLAWAYLHGENSQLLSLYSAFKENYETFSNSTPRDSRTDEYDPDSVLNELFKVSLNTKQFDLSLELFALFSTPGIKITQANQLLCSYLDTPGYKMNLKGDAALIPPRTTTIILQAIELHATSLQEMHRAHLSETQEELDFKFPQETCRSNQEQRLKDHVNTFKTQFECEESLLECFQRLDDLHSAKALLTSWQERVSTISDPTTNIKYLVQIALKAIKVDLSLARKIIDSASEAAEQAKKNLSSAEHEKLNGEIIVAKMTMYPSLASEVLKGEVSDPYARVLRAIEVIEKMRECYILAIPPNKEQAPRGV